MSDPIGGVAAAAILVGFVAWWNYRFSRQVSPWPALVAAAVLPLVIPPQWIYARMFATVWAVVLAAKSFEHARGRTSDARMLETGPRFLFWLFIPPDSRVAQDLAEAASIRRAGTHRMGRGLAKVPLALALAAVHLSWPPLHDNVWLQAWWALWLTWSGLSAITDLLSGLAMQTGLHVAETFHAPLQATSPRDFWGRRWNLFVHRWAMRNLMPMLGARRHPLRATIIVFLASGAMHEYVVAACIGTIPTHFGWMIAFFGVHGIAVAAQMAAERRFGRGPWMPRPVAWALHLGWLTATSPLFFASLGEVFTLR